MSADLELVTLEEAAQRTGKTPHNIRDYIQRQRINKYNSRGEQIQRAKSGELRVSLRELRTFLGHVQQATSKHQLDGLHDELGFHSVPEHQRTKHVHRLHPYLGKFIPQLVEWFLGRFFSAESRILDPFMGSGTTLVQANELHLHALGIDVSPFNCLIAKVKTDQYDLIKARAEILDIERRVAALSTMQHATLPLFPEDAPAQTAQSLLAACTSDYLKAWFAPRALAEMLYYRALIPQYTYQDLLKVILSRAARSSRLVSHYDLATPKAPLPVGEPYWCQKHKRYCTPIDNCLEKIHAYSEDTARRLAAFARVRSEKAVVVLQGDSRTLDIRAALTGTPLADQRFDGVFTSPPYVGQIDYHDQHTYAYELFGFPRQDALEIGAKREGKSKRAQEAYVEGIAAVFRNVLSVLKPDAKLFIVANDRFNLYPQIATAANLKIVQRFERAVTKRTGRGDDPYQETIFEMQRATTP